MTMTVERLINLLVTLTLIEMMIAIGMGVHLADVVSVLKQCRVTVRAALANYLVVPAVTVALLLSFDAQPAVAAGFLILAACPGAPYGPPFTSLAKGDVATSVGLMVILASSSAFFAPFLLGVLLPIVSGDSRVQVDAAALFSTLLLTQLLPLAVGIGLNAWRPSLAAKLTSPANRLSALLNLAAISLILVTQFRLFLGIRAAAFGGMFLLLIASLAGGWLLGGATREGRKAMALATSLRNVGVSMVIAAGSFAGTPALTAVLAYAVVELPGSLVVALWWGRRAQRLRSDGAIPA